MSAVADNLQAVGRRIDAAARAAGRDAASIALVAVTKTFDAATIRAAHAAGQRRFGESYVQEALPKMDALADLDIEWHFIGPLQRNKTNAVAQRFAWVHGLDRLRIAERLSDARHARAPLNVCVQVNLSGETSKHGVAPDALAALAHAVASLPNLRLRGLMTVPEASDDVGLQRARFAALRSLSDRLRAGGLALDTLSMGMSGDLEAAIAEGATIVRVGSAIFGARARAQDSPPDPQVANP